MSDLISRADAIEAVAGAKAMDTFGRYDMQNIGIDWALKALNELPSADRPQVKYNSAEEQIAETCDKPKVNSAEWVAEKEKEFEELHRPNEDSKPEPYVPEASTERVVHCKDCIYSYSRQPEGEKLFVCENRFGMSGWVREDEFCSSGSL